MSTDQRLKQIFDSYFQRLIQEGCDPNDAVAQALQYISSVGTNNSIQSVNASDSSLSRIVSQEEDSNNAGDSQSAAANTFPTEEALDKMLCTLNEENQGMYIHNNATNGGNEEKKNENLRSTFDVQKQTSMEDQDDSQDQDHIVLNFDTIKLCLDKVLKTNKYSEICTLCFQGFSSISTLNHSFLARKDSQEVHLGVDLMNVRDSFNLLIETNQPSILNSMKNGLEALVSQSWRVCSNWKTKDTIRQFLIVFEHPLLFDPDYRGIVGGLCKLFFFLPKESKAMIYDEWKRFNHEKLKEMLDMLQQFITIRLYSGEYFDTVFAAASILGFLYELNESHSFTSYTSFYNDVVNSDINLIKDYSKSNIYRTRAQRDLYATMGPRELADLSFCDFPFLLDAASKSNILQIDSTYQQRTEMHDSMTRSFLIGNTIPYLVLRVRRDQLISDTLMQLARIPLEEMKKPLKVKFVGEDAVDEGGVQKEFFQIIIRKLLDPAYGMFKYNEESHTLWFNSDSLEANMEFELIGQLLGLAIYNSVILDVHFPPIVYKKIKGIPPTLKDLDAIQPQLGNGFHQLLNFEGDVESIYARSFQISFEVFGAIKTVNLKENGESIPLTNQNRDEYVALYVKYLLETSVSNQYNSFYQGFQRICGGEVIEMFRWEELELLICGSPDFDFEALESVTRYDDGFTEKSFCIRNFWSIVHELPIEDKKKLLMFATGSDRIPIRGLSNMIFIISRNGGDSDRLPTAHTCFNHLLLPDYSSKEKLKERLVLAINQCEGFGMR